MTMPMEQFVDFLNKSFYLAILRKHKKVSTYVISSRELKWQCQGYRIMFSKKLFRDSHEICGFPEYITEFLYWNLYIICINFWPWVGSLISSWLVLWIITHYVCKFFSNIRNRIKNSITKLLWR